MIRSAILVASVAFGATAAVAADLPYEQAPAEYAVPAAPSTWSGAYVGAQAGYGWAKANNKNVPDTHPNGAIVGAYAGYNHQFDNSPVVAGVETDLNYNFGSDRKNFVNGRVRNEQEWSGSTRGRIGYAADRVMPYATAGVAYGGHKLSGADGVVSGRDDKTLVGYTVGAGVEGLVTDNITARVEYRYTDYGSKKFDIGGAREKVSVSDNRVMAGAAYKFGW